VNASCSIERIRIQRSIFPLFIVVLVCLSAAAIAQKAPPVGEADYIHLSQLVAEHALRADNGQADTIHE
jgi:hypothetical protein